MKKHLFVIALLSAPTMACAEQARPFSMSAGLDYSSGTYGTANSTDIWYYPVTGKYEAGKLTLKATASYLSITGPGNVFKDIGATSGAAVATRTTQSGMGDIVASLGYNVYDDRSNDVLIDLLGKVKFATADETKGLGTGRNDYAIQADGYKRFDRTTLFGTLGYKMLGSPAGMTLQNVFYGTLGASQRFTDETSAGLMLDLRERAIATGYAQREVTVYLAKKLDANWKGQIYAVKGFAHGSPDWGGGATLGYHF